MGAVESGNRWRRRDTKMAVLRSVFAVAVVISSEFLKPLLPRPVWNVVSIVVIVGAALFMAFSLIRYARRRREASAAPGPPTEPFVVHVEDGTTRARLPFRLVLREDAMVFSHVQPEFRGEPTIAYAAVETVGVHPAWIEIATGEERVRVVPASYAERKRLLWELAVRCNDAMERGIDETATPHAAPAPVASADDCEPGVTGLGSALAPPPRTATPAPPRKSGLGVGLFPPPPEGE